MSNQYNPFKENRTEQMRDLWKYYVPFPGLDAAGKPIVVQGGRGSGKTMFFQCNSWRQVLSQVRKNSDQLDAFFEDNGFIGIYYRVDTTFVSAMRGREEKNWAGIFETYLGICILQEILDLLIELNKEMNFDESVLVNFAQNFSARICPDKPVDSLQSMRNETDRYLDHIEDRINGISIQTSPILRWVNGHRFISDICEACNSLLGKNILYKVFIDEYETLQEYQQKLINTWIKHSTLPVVFNIGLRPEGMKTTETISDTEVIEAPHDFELVTLEINPAEYECIIKDICKKRIVLGKEQGRIPKEAKEDIDFYLGTYCQDLEIKRFEQYPRALPHIQKLRDRIIELGDKQGLEKDIIQDYIKVLCDDAPILNSRLHYALLCKDTAYTPSLEDLYLAYSNNNDRYKEWKHNRQHGIVFLLCKETKREKMYFGFDAYAALSSSIVRYFLELCEQAFRIAFLNGFNWECPISPEIQTEATRYVSEYKIVDIAGYEPYGKEMRMFVQYLGQIFYKLHTYDNNTLGEPEPNHFSTEDLSLPDETRKLIRQAIMWNVLQPGEPTKRKQSRLSPETVDYYLNRVYAPYFGISYRNQRKIQIGVGILKELFSGDEARAKAAFRSYFKTKVDQEGDSDFTPQQMTFFDHLQGV